MWSPLGYKCISQDLFVCVCVCVCVCVRVCKLFAFCFALLLCVCVCVITILRVHNEVMTTYNVEVSIPRFADQNNNLMNLSCYKQSQ